MKYFIAFILCLFCFSTDVFAIYNVDNQNVMANHSTVSTASISPHSPTKKLRYRDRVALKYKQFKAKIKNKRWVVGFLLGAGLTLVVGLLLMTPFNNKTQPNSNANVSFNEAVNLSVAFLIGVVLLIFSGLLFIAALIAAFA